MSARLCALRASLIRSPKLRHRLLRVVGLGASLVLLWLIGAWFGYAKVTSLGLLFGVLVVSAAGVVDGLRHALRRDETAAPIPRAPLPVDVQLALRAGVAERILGDVLLPWSLRINMAVAYLLDVPGCDVHVVDAGGGIFACDVTCDAPAVLVASVHRMINGALPPDHALSLNVRRLSAPPDPARTTLP